MYRHLCLILINFENNAYLCTTFTQGQILCLSRLEETVRDAEFIFEVVIDELTVKQDLFESRYYF